MSMVAALHPFVKDSGDDSSRLHSDAGKKLLNIAG
jgi:hypothetical protein